MNVVNEIDFIRVLNELITYAQQNNNSSSDVQIVYRFKHALKIVLNLFFFIYIFSRVLIIN